MSLSKSMILAAFCPRKSSQVASAICTFCLFFSRFCFDFSYFHLVFAKSRQAKKDKTGCDISPKCRSDRGVCGSSAGGFDFFFSVKISGEFLGPLGFRDLDQDFGSDFVVRAGGELTS